MNPLELAPAVWRKSSYSGGDEGSCVEIASVWRKASHSGGHEGDCVEIASGWQTSSYSGSDEGSCVEVARGERVVAVRDSKDVSGPVLAFDRGEWRGLVAEIKTGAYELT